MLFPNLFMLLILSYWCRRRIPFVPRSRWFVATNASEQFRLGWSSSRGFYSPGIRWWWWNCRIGAHRSMYPILLKIKCFCPFIHSLQLLPQHTQLPEPPLTFTKVISNFRYRTSYNSICSDFVITANSKIMGPLFGNDIENVYEIAKENGVCLLLHFKNIKCQLQHYLCQLLTLNIYISAFSVRWFFLWKFKRRIGGGICVPRGKCNMLWICWYKNWNQMGNNFHNAK